MEIGRLRHRITLQKQVNRLNQYGATITEWQDIATLWAEVRPLSGREYFSAQQIQSEISLQIWLRFQPEITPTMRVKHNKQYYEILAVINHQGRNRSLQLMCKEIHNDNR